MRNRLFATLALAFFALPLPSPAQQSTNGQWQMGPDLPYFPVHMSMMPNGKLIMWPGDGGVSGNDPRQLDPATGTVTPLAAPGYDIFCAGQSILPDGRLFVAGGHISNNVGLPAAVIYDPNLNTWTRQPDMNAGRWYPSEQVMPNGDVLVVAGDIDLTVGEDTLPQVWQSATGNWRSLSNAQLALGLYPTLSLAPNGKVFNSGPSITTRYLDTSGTGAWSVVGDHIFQGVRDYDAMVMYQPGKILVVGGGDPATNTAETIDLTQASPAWKSTNNLAYARRQLNAVMLPDGKVLVTGGTGGPGFSNPDPNLAIMAAEEWDPATGNWTTLANAAVPRLYHSISMLMPDGRVFSTGGNSYTQSEFFSPPYLFAGPRPTITSAPASVGNGQSLFVGTPDAANITQVSWVRMPSTTHTFSMSQAFSSSTAITRGTGGITITSPNDPTMPPGFYMLFILNNGVPSVAATVHLGPAAANSPVPVASSLSPSSVPNGSSPTPVTVTGTGFTTDSQVLLNGTRIPTSYVSSTQITGLVPASAMLNVGSVPLSVATPAPGGGTSAALNLSVVQAPAPLLTQTGTIIARITAPTGMGSKNLEVIRDGDLPPVGTVDTRRQYDTFSGGNPATEDWIGYQYTAPQTFAKVVFQEGINFVDGGFFASGPNVQVRQNGAWVNVQNQTTTPSYPGNNRVNFETFTLNFTPITGDAIRIDGAPGGAAYFTSVGELEVFGPSGGGAAATISAASPSSAFAGDPPVRIAVTGANFTSASVVQWNGAALPTTFVSATQLTATIPAADLASAGTATLCVGTSAITGTSGVPFTVKQAPAPNLTQTGTILARILAPTGGGNHNPEIIRDGDTPPQGSNDSSRQYDTYSGGAAAEEDWIGYGYSAPQTFAKVVFQEGINFGDGGWFNNLNVQVRQNGAWVNVSSQTVSPAYPPNDGVSFETYTVTFPPVSGDGIRIDGAPGGSAFFTSVGELSVYGPAAASSSLGALSPASATAGDPPVHLTVTGTGFDSSSVVQWNGNPLTTTYASASSVTALVPAANLAVAGSVQITVNSSTGGTAGPLTFTINPAPVPNLTQTGTILASVPNALGGGNHNLEVIRDGDLPAVGTTDSQRQWDSWNGGGASTDAWIGYSYAAPQTFTKVVFQEGKNFFDGGWFNTLTVQVRQNGTWMNVPNQSSNPVYPPNDNVNFESYTITFPAVTGDAIRIDGQPGGSAYFISVGELQVFGQ